MTSVKLCNGDYERPLKVEIFDFDDNGHHDFIGEFLTNVTDKIFFVILENFDYKTKRYLYK